MLINKLLEEKNMTKYQLAKKSGVPYTTINDICTGKSQLTKCSVETIYRISKTLKVSIETLIEPYFEKRCDFEIFKSNTCHRLKELGDIKFIIELLEQDEIHKFYKKMWYPESLYLLAMLDYISRQNNIPLCTQYDDMRSMKLKEVIFPTSVLIDSQVSNSEEPKNKSIKESIPEFIRFNIVESEVRNVI